MHLVATQCVVLAVAGERCNYLPGDALPEIPDDQAARLVRLGAARETVPALAALAKPKARAKAAAKAATQPEPEPSAAGEPLAA